MPATLSTSNPAIRTLLLCDLVASTQLVERVGDSTAADLLARHDRFARDLLSTFNGREIDKSDGFLLLFERPIEAVRFAVAYQSKLREFGATFNVSMASRVGIHLGEVVLRENSPEDVARGAKPLEVEGLAKAIAARVMSLAGDGCILLTRAAYDFARRGSVGMEDEAPLRWAVHGRYRLAGVEDLVEVCEVAEPGEASLAPPASAAKAQRADDQNTVGPVARSTPPVVASHARQAVPTETVLAVLAFDNLSSDPEMQFFSDGVSEEIIQRLSRGAKLSVAATGRVPRLVGMLSSTGMDLGQALAPINRDYDPPFTYPGRIARVIFELPLRVSKRDRKEEAKREGRVAMARQ
jgi:class 3 adenylate cyclase